MAPTNLSPFLQDLVRFNKGEVMVRTVYVVGKPRSGKTTMVKTIAAKIKRAFGDRVFFCLTNDYREVVKNIRPDKPINVFFVDDAMRLQFSRNAQTKKNKEDAVNAAELAHIAEKRGMKEGLILVFIGSQTLTGVDYQLRAQAEVIMIKSLNLALDKPYLELLGEDPAELEDWLAAVRRREPWALSRARVILLEGTAGWYSFKPVECKPDLEIMKSGEEVAAVGEEAAAGKPQPAINVTLSTDLNSALDAILDQMCQEPEWVEGAQIYKLYRTGLTIRDIAAKLGMANSTVLDRKRSAQGEAKRRLGGVYEQMVLLRLKDQGFAAERLGGESEPDILAEKDCRKYVIACKIYEDSKATVTMPISEIKPELYYAKAQGAELLVYFYNMAWGVELIKGVDPRAPPERITFSRQELLEAPLARL